jgi:hypothetical protein
MEEVEYGAAVFHVLVICETCEGRELVLGLREFTFKRKVYMHMYAQLILIHMASVVIRISPQTRKLLKSVATREQTYDQIIREAVELYEALLAEFREMLYDPESEWTSHEDLLRELGFTEEEIKRERERLD